MEKELDINEQLIGSCSCLTKTPDPKYHDKLCYYRLLMEKISKRNIIYDGDFVWESLQDIEENVFYALEKFEEFKGEFKGVINVVVEYLPDIPEGYDRQYAKEEWNVPGDEDKSFPDDQFDYGTGLSIEDVKNIEVVYEKVPVEKVPDDPKPTEEFLVIKAYLKSIEDKIDCQGTGYFRANKIRVGDYVEPLEPENVLHCGTGIYDRAVCVNLLPFILVSDGADMQWNNLDIKDYHCIGKTDVKTLAKCLKRYYG